MRNWKTTLAGILALATIALKIAQDPTNISADDLAGALASIGLIFAKDHNVSGTGNALKPQPK